MENCFFISKRGIQKIIVIRTRGMYTSVLPWLRVFEIAANTIFETVRVYSRGYTCRGAYATIGVNAVRYRAYVKTGEFDIILLYFVYLTAACTNNEL